MRAPNGCKEKLSSLRRNLYLEARASVCSRTACPPPSNTGLASRSVISDGINYLTACFSVVGTACLDYKPRICQLIYLCLQKDVLQLIRTDRQDERRRYFWPGANESLTPQGVMRHIAPTDARARRPRVCHAEAVCAASLLGSHERRVSTE